MEPIAREINPIRILFVEDELLIREWVSQSLTEEGFAVETAGDAAEALRHLAARPVDALLTDLNLPGAMDGATLARRARELFPHLPVVYASARVGSLGAEARVPGSLSVSKPYAPSAVARLLAAMVRSDAECVPA